MKRIPVIFLTIFVFGTFPAYSDAKTTLTFMTWRSSQPRLWDEIIARFESRYPDIRIRCEIGPHSSTQFHDLLTQKLKNRDPDVDVFFMDVVWPAEFASAGWVLRLDSFFPEEERDKFLSGAIASNTYKGHVYGLPLFIDTGLLYYRKDLLEKYGFLPPETWQQLVSQAAFILKEERQHQPTLRGYSGQFKQYEGLICNMLEFIKSNGGDILAGGGYTVLLNETEAITAVRFVRDEIIGKIAPRGVLYYQEPESLAIFIQGNAVFHRNWPYAWREFNNPEKSKIAGKVGVASLPHFPGSRSASTLGGWQLGISKFSRHRQEAWKFIEFVGSRDIQKLIALRVGKAPTRKSLYEDQDILTQNSQFMVKEAFLKAVPRPVTPLYPLISYVLQSCFSKIISDPTSDIRSLADEATEEINYYLSWERDL